MAAKEAQKQLAAAAEQVPPPVPEFDEQRCKALMRVLTSVVWISDPYGRFIAPQPSWTAYTGQPWPEHQGTGWFRAVHPDDREQVGALLERARLEKTVYRATGRLWNAPSGDYRRVEARGVPIMDASGEIVEWVGTCRDVEEQKRAEQVLREADRRKDEFIAILAHELRNPLAPIRNAVQVLKLRDAADMQLAWARTVIERQVAQMARLLEDLLDVSRISQNKLKLHKERVTLDAVLDAALEISRPLMEQHGHHFELNVLTAPVYLDADPPRLIQAFCNLLNNAAKYTDRGGRIELTVRQEGQMAVVEVADSGIGISPEMLPKLFTLFTQDRPALERSQGGLGIGLSIVKALVELHGGSVEARSGGLGQGSRFTVNLPVARARSDFGQAKREPARAGRRLRVLVADDNVDAAETMSVLLEMLGHDVRVASDGAEALEVGQAHSPEIALLDIGMPKMNGYEVARQLKERVPGVVLVAVTGWGQPEDIRRATAAGFDHHLVKPVDPEELVAMLATCVGEQG